MWRELRERAPWSEQRALGKLAWPRGDRKKGLESVRSQHRQQPMQPQQGGNMGTIKTPGGKHIRRGNESRAQGCYIALGL